LFENNFPPNPNEIEISLLGGKFIGESIVIHLGDNNWGIVDSFNYKGKPASIQYLKSMNQDLSNVKFILLTHWHQDHCKGIAETAELCPNAELWISDCFCSASFIYFLELYNDIIPQTKFDSLNHVRRYLDLPRTSKRASQDKLIHRNESNNPLEIYALTPSDETKKLMELHIKKMINKLESKKISLNEKKVLKLKDENLKSVALVMKLGSVDIILAGDLEIDEKDRAGIGLSSILDSKVITKENTIIFKIPHHGSKTGYDENIWNQLLSENPILMLTPYKGGKNVLPTKEMIDTLCDNYSQIYITSNPHISFSNTLKHSRSVKKKLKKLGVDKINKIQGEIGHIKIRFDINDVSPNISLFGRSEKLCVNTSHKK